MAVSPGWPVAASLPDGAVATPMAPQERIDVPGAEAVDSLGHLALERKPPHFAVGHDVEPAASWREIDGAILYGLELRVTKTPRALRNATGRRRMPTASACAVIIAGSDDQIEQSASMQYGRGHSPAFEMICVAHYQQ
jgi:hypothetical protein